MDHDAYRIAQRTSRARAEIHALVDDIGRERLMTLLLEIYADLESLKALPSRHVLAVASNGVVEVPATIAKTPAVSSPLVTKDEPAEGTLRADVLTVLRAAKVPLRTGQILKLVQAIRPDAKGPSVGSAIWNFVREHRVLKRTVGGNDYYATTQAVLSLFDDGFNPDDFGGAADDEGGGTV